MCKYSFIYISKLTDLQIRIPNSRILNSNSWIRIAFLIHPIVLGCEFELRMRFDLQT